jgi:hypothetical protein
VHDDVPQPHDPKNENGKKQPPAHVSMKTRVVRQEQFVMELVAWHAQVPHGRQDTHRLHGS